MGEAGARAGAPSLWARQAIEPASGAVRGARRVLSLRRARGGGEAPAASRRAGGGRALSRQGLGPESPPPRKRAPRLAGARGAAPAGAPAPAPAAGLMLQMVKTLAQFTIALEDMREQRPDAASGESAGCSGAEAAAEEPGEAQVWGGGGAAPKTQREQVGWGARKGRARPAPSLRVGDSVPEAGAEREQRR